MGSNYDTYITQSWFSQETVVPSGAESAVAPEEVLPEDLPETMSVVGIDDNIHPKPLQQVIDEVCIHRTCTIHMYIIMISNPALN